MSNRSGQRWLPMLLALLLSLPMGAPLQAQSAAPENRDLAEVSEPILIDALALSPVEPSSDSVRMRALSGSAATSAASAPAPAPRAAGLGRANLLLQFQPGSTELTPLAGEQLRLLGQALQSDALVGFDFRVRATSSAQVDAALVSRRLDALLATLTRQHGVLLERLMPEGVLVAGNGPALPDSLRLTLTTIPHPPRR
ncbi:MAG: hypothetical protein RJA44_155 [Pseudomonadota bacterium]|jgi:hypothetical protein